MVARTDKTTDPALLAQLLLTRRGQAYFSRKLNELSDADFDGDSLLSGWDRRHVIAHVGLNARALTRLTEWAATGVETPMYDSPEQRGAEIDVAATLPTQALRNLSDHAAIHLNVEWRDLEPEQWTAEVRTAQGRIVPASETVWMRCREVWIHAIDLANGGRFADIPDAVLERVLTDVLGAWTKRRSTEALPHVVMTTGDGRVFEAPGAQPDPTPLEVLHVVGELSDLAGWATGRSTAGATLPDGSPAPTAPRWL